MTNTAHTVKLNQANKIDMKSVVAVAGDDSNKEPVQQPDADNLQTQTPPEQPLQLPPPDMDSDSEVPRKPRNSKHAVNETEEKRKRTLTLARYRQSKRFGHYLVEQGFDLSPTRLVTLSLSALDTLLNDVRFTVSCKNSGGMIEGMAIAGMGVLEQVVTPFYNVKGLSAALARSDTYLDCVEEIALENQSYVYTKPTYRLILEILKTAYIVNHTHTQIAQLKSTPEGRRAFEAELNRMRQDDGIQIQGVVQPQQVSVGQSPLLNGKEDDALEQGRNKI